MYSALQCNFAMQQKMLSESFSDLIIA